MTVRFPEAGELSSVLRAASYQLANLCLYQASKWTAELAAGVDEPDTAHDDDNTDDNDGSNSRHHRQHQRADDGDSDTRTIDAAFLSVDAAAAQSANVSMLAGDDVDMDTSFLDDLQQQEQQQQQLADLTPIKAPAGRHAASSPVRARHSVVDESALDLPLPPGSAVDADAQRALEAQEFTALHLAKVYFDCKEFARVGPSLAQCRSLKALFFRTYTRFLLGEKHKEERMHDMAEPSLTVLNDQLHGIIGVLQPMALAAQLDGPCLYVLAIALREAGLTRAARVAFGAAVTAMPLLWCAWSELALLLGDDDAQAVDGLRGEAHDASGLLLGGLSTPAHWMRAFFAVRAMLLMQRNIACLRLCGLLQRFFPRSAWVTSQHAMALYNLREFAPAAQLFEQLRVAEPNRLDDLDAYSNILYVQEESAKLSMLAHDALRIDRYRPESCLIVGNYYSIKSEHVKAVAYFKRSLRLDPRNVSAWTLLGHEYMELKNTEAAIEAYRKALDANQRDYRAWYGLGQTYEILKMPLYALHYYRRATSLRPYDARMWCALGQCFERLGRNGEAVRCHERAVGNGDREGVAFRSLARLYQTPDVHDTDRAAFYFRKELDRLERAGDQGQQMIEALFYLAQHCHQKKLWDDAERYCYRLMDYAGKEKEEAKALLRAIHASRRADEH
jgi:anaphase-promoting complex subunit 8